ncbi:MAG TPA: tRNA 2-thiocytidine(32) synthetase TtcA [Polyangia bacterium]|nr:tRNA 2-thiocytidine(32) synthetase TtcA [Polyangia bacterium]
MQRLPVLGQPPPIAHLPVATPLRSTELGAFRYGSKLERRIVGKVGQAVCDYKLLEDGDRVMVCVSGGKDSYALLDTLLLLKRKSPIRYELIAVNVDQGWPGYQTEAIEAHLASRGVERRMVRAHEIAGIVERVLRPHETGATPCSLCSRLRRGVLYGLAAELGATKIALGHHLDDAAETLMMNLFFSGSLRAMAPRFTSDDGRNVVIRPLVFVEEKDLIEYAEARRYPVVRCSCPTCGLPDQQRQVVKRLLASLEAEHPGLKPQMLAAMKNVRAHHLLDRELLARLA